MATMTPLNSKFQEDRNLPFSFSLYENSTCKKETKKWALQAYTVARLWSGWSLSNSLIQSLHEQGDSQVLLAWD